MHYYKTTLRLSGSTLNEVVKIVSAPELLILQFMHGPDATTRVKEIKNEKINLFQEKGRLRDLYESGLKRQDQSIDKIFGALGTLPERLPPELLEQYDIYNDPMTMVDPNVELEKVKDAARSGKVDKNDQSAKTQTEVDNLNRVIPAEEVNIGDLME